MKLEVIRFNQGKDSTNGILFDITDERKFLCYTLEDERCLLLGDSQENNNIKENGFIGRSTQAYFRVYKKIAKAVKEEEEVTIVYRDFSKSLILDSTAI